MIRTQIHTTNTSNEVAFSNLGAFLKHFMSVNPPLSLTIVNQSKTGQNWSAKSHAISPPSPCLAFPKEPKCVVLWAPVLIWQVRKYISSCFNRFNAFQRTSRNESSSWLSSYSSVLHGQTYELMHQLGHIRSL